MFLRLGRAGREAGVSVLFSEPKIPQTTAMAIILFGTQRFSALQRAENSSNEDRRRRRQLSHAFQCSSASRKFLKTNKRIIAALDVSVSVLFSEPKIPQSS